MKIYTRTGDTGETGLAGGRRTTKDDDRLETCGTLDELNSWLGLARAETPPDEVDRVLARLQNELFELGAELAGFTQNDKTRVTDEDVARLEADIDRFVAMLPSQNGFLLPGGTKPAAALHIARTVCRRAERRLVRLASRTNEPCPPVLLVYMNRLSDLLYILARTANHLAGRPDVPWRSTRSSES
ncbi:MAG: cob(I)yrinic acid a,c-diamide adenosyltransferase [Pirellulales bacterium]|nr:cob(I)yrinic acid a,c-diamide adenosyltransferase [Pirellulales bacterium]